MDRVQSHPPLERHQRHSMFLVPRGSMKTKSKIILSSFFNDSFGSSRRTLIGFSSDPLNFLVYLPSGIYSSQSLIVVIRDRDDCFVEWNNLSSVVVHEDQNVFKDFETIFAGQSTSNSFVQLLNNGNPNQVGQVISTLTQNINRSTRWKLSKSKPNLFDNWPNRAINWLDTSS